MSKITFDPGEKVLAELSPARRSMFFPVLRLMLWTGPFWISTWPPMLWTPPPWKLSSGSVGACWLRGCGSAGGAACAT